MLRINSPCPLSHATARRRLPPAGSSLEETSARVAKVAGFSLHAGVTTARHERRKLERLCRYDVQGSTSVARGRKPGATITRPAIAEPRLSLTPTGNVRYQLKTPYRDGTTHVMLLRASCPPPFGPAFGCSKSLPAILSSPWILCSRMYGMPRAQGCAGAAMVRLATLVPRPRVNLARLMGCLRRTARTGSW